MTNADNLNLEEAIKNIRCRPTPTLDEQILSDSSAALIEAMKSKPTALRIIFKSKVSKLVIFVIIIIAAMIGAKSLFIPSDEIPLAELPKQAIENQKQPLVSEQPQIKQDIQPEPKAEDKKTELNTELKQIMDMFAANDIDGLIAMLSSQHQEIKLAAALYLAKIGDERASQTLNQLSIETDDNELANMFSITASLIQKRLEEENAQQKVALIQEAVLSGFITDTETGEAVIDANITISSEKNYTTTTDENGFYYFENVEDDGNYRIKITSKEYVGMTEQEKYPVVFLSKDSREVKNFKLGKACMVDLLVVNEANEPVPNVQIFIANQAEKNKIIDTGFNQITNEKGFLVIGGLMRGTFNLTAVYKGKNTYADPIRIQSGFAPARIAIKLENPNVIEYREIVLKRGAEIQGQIQSAEGLPQGDLTISVQPLWWDLPFPYQNYVPDYDGTFELENITSDTYQIRLKTMEDSNDIYKFQAELPPKEEFFVIKVPQYFPDVNVLDANVLDSNIPDTNIPDLNAPDSNIPEPNMQELTEEFSNFGT